MKKFVFLAIFQTPSGLMLGIVSNDWEDGSIAEVQVLNRMC